MTALAVWQEHYGFSDAEAARQLGLNPSEFLRQRSTRPSRQTSLLALLVAIYKPDMAAIAEAAAELARPPRAEEPGPDLSSDWD